MSREFDGTQIPAMFKSMQPNDALAQRTNSFSLKEGVVTAILYPDNKDNISKREIEYNVAVVEYVPGAGANLQEYRNCRIADMFGTTNNFVNYTLQPSTDNIDSVGGRKNKDVFKDGARCTILCLAGVNQAGYAIIIGGVKHGDGKIYSEKDGQFYDFNFNGIQQLINDDGEWIINFSTPIDQDGKKENEKAAGTQIKIDKDGRITLLDNEKQTIKIDREAKNIEISNGGDSITIDKTAKSISLKSGGETKIDAGKDINAKAGGSANLESGGAMKLKSGGILQQESSGMMSIKSGGQWKLQASGNVMVQAGGEISFIGSGGPLLKSNGPIATIGAGGVPAAGVGISQCIGVGNLGAPVVSTIITGSSTTFIGA